MTRNKLTTNIKSSVYQPIATDLFGQFSTEQHLNYHYRHINEAKASVDNRTPQCFKNIIKKRKSDQSLNVSRPSSRLSQLSTMTSCESGSWNVEDRSILKNALHLDGKHSIRDPLSGLKTSDKMALYVDIMKKNEAKKFQSQSKSPNVKDPKNKSKNYEFDPNVFTAPGKPFTPHRNAANRSKSKISQSRIYNPPIKLCKAMKMTKGNLISHSIQHNKHEDNESNLSYQKKWLTEQAEQAQVRQAVFTEKSGQSPDSAYFDSVKSQGHEKASHSLPATKLPAKFMHDKWDEDSKYLQFMSDVTEDIISRGVYTNRVLKSVLKSHIQKRSGELSMPKMLTLVDKLKEDLGIPCDDISDERNCEYGEKTSNIEDSSSKLLDMFQNGENSNLNNVIQTHANHQYIDEPLSNTSFELEKLSIHLSKESRLKQRVSSVSNESEDLCNFNAAPLHLDLHSEKNSEKSINVDDANHPEIISSDIRTNGEDSTSDNLESNNEDKPSLRKTASNYDNESDIFSSVSESQNSSYSASVHSNESNHTSDNAETFVSSNLSVNDSF